MAHRKFNPGDKVRILPEWWDVLAGDKHARYNSYVQRGKDHIYVIDHYEGNDVYLVNADGWWSEDKLVLAFAVEESESEINIDGLL